MSSSQTMTAPAVGHRPPDTGPDMSLYDYGGSQTDNDLASPRSDSAIRALHNSASDQPESPPNGLPTFSGMIDIKTEPEDADEGVAAEDRQNQFRKQSAASALLAQLLGNQSSVPPAPAEQPHGEGSNDIAQENKGTSSGQMSTEEGDNSVLPHWNEPQASADWQEHADEKKAGEGIQEHQDDQEHKDDTALKGSDPTADLVDPLVSKSGLDQSDFFASFDITAAPKTPLEALQQNEMLTAAYLSQSAELSALGYSHGNLNLEGTSSIEGSEPRIQAFAKLEFDDGHFYVNTYSFILGRDVRAARAAHHREVHVRQAMRHSGAKSSSGGNASHTPNRVKREESAIMGSVVSDRGGIMGFDPDVPSHLPPQLSRRSSNSSFVEPGAPLHATPAQLQSTDYNALAMQSLYDGNGDAKPVDILALLPSPDACPTIPIHPPAMIDGSAAGHRGISRRHVRIAYNFDKNLFEMEVMGRNGAFIGADWLSPGQIRPLHSGDYIQIGGVRIRFLLPDVPIGETGADRIEEPHGDEEDHVNAPASVGAENLASEAGGSEKPASESPENQDTSKVAKIVLKTKEPDPTKPVPSIETSENGQQPMRRRGPGRPPKDGIMSKRERAELAREQKLAAKREANGGVTPPPANKSSKAGKPPKDSADGLSPTAKPEKRKYTKRKKPDGTYMDVPIPSTEGGQIPMEQRPEEYIKVPPVKKRKPSRSPSPNYPPESAYTPEDLAKPPYNYAVLIFDALTEAGTPMTLKQIYRALKLKYPYFRFKCETEGWTSSVRHNLNGNGHLFMHAERDGKGWSWQLRPGASVEKEKKRRPSPPPSSQPSTAPAPTQHYIPQLPQTYSNPPAVPAQLPNKQFQFPSMPSNPYAAPAPTPAPASTPQHTKSYPPPQAPFPIPSPIRNNLPPAFAQTAPSTYTSPYASDPPPQLAHFQQTQPQPPSMAAPPLQSPYPPQDPPPLPNVNSQPPPLPPNHTPPLQQTPHSNPAAPEPTAAMVDNSDASSFNDRANKAIDDFEAVLMEDYEDKNYIREVLKSARARVLGGAKESSFPGGEPKDEAVILDALRNLIGSLKEE